MYNDLDHLFNAGECILYVDDVVLTAFGDIVKLYIVITYWLYGYVYYILVILCNCEIVKIL